MTANASSSSATDPSSVPALGLDLLSTSRLPSLPSAFLSGRDRDLLAPVRFLAPGDMPTDSPPPGVDRGELARALATANAAYGHPAAERLAEQLADPETRVVVTGQQPGLFGGPLYALSKMVAAVRWAETLTAAGHPAVAVFWVATEDHDWAEIAQASFLTRGELRRFDLGPDPTPLLPVGMRTFGDGLEAILNELEDDVDPSGAYRPDARIGEAFCRLMVATLGARAPLMLDSMLPEVKKLQQPLLRRLVERRDELAEQQAAADAEIERRGYALQVKPQPGLSPLFLLHGQERRRIAWDEAGSYTLRGLDEAYPLEQLYQLIDENPAAVSPGVLARPAIQDALLGTTLQIMGPAELSYMSQVAPAYSVLDIEPPWTSLRPQVLALEARQAGYLEELGVSLEELFETPLDRLVADKLGVDPVGPVRAQVDALLAGLDEPLLALDRGLAGPLEKTRSHIGRGLDQLAGKVAGAVARRHDVWSRRLEQLHSACLPGGKPQERVLSVGHFLARYGTDVGSVLADHIGLDPRTLHIIRIPPAPRSAPA
ncbi:MAG: bacillithiol biosynthesis cysteine-adding enzyme BshC [Acidobacteriota bacterium]